MRIELEHTTRERLRVPVTAPIDPTSTPPEFSLTATEATDPGTWVPGSWSGTWSTTSGKVEAWTPITGVAGFMLAAATEYKLWARWDQGDETPVHELGTIVAT